MEVTKGMEPSVPWPPAAAACTHPSQPTQGANQCTHPSPSPQATNQVPGGSKKGSSVCDAPSPSNKTGCVGSKHGKQQPESKSLFHVSPPPDMGHQDTRVCMAVVRSYIESLEACLCGAGPSAVDHLAALLKQSHFAEVAGQFQQDMCGVQTVVAKETKQLKAHLDTVKSQLEGAATENGGVVSNNIETLGECMVWLLASQHRILSLAMSQLANTLALIGCHSDLPLHALAGQSAAPMQNGGESCAPKAGSVQQKKGCDSPSGLRKHLNSFLAKLAPRTAEGSGQDAGQSSWYVELGPSGDRGEAGPAPGNPALAPGNPTLAPGNPTLAPGNPTLAEPGVPVTNHDGPGGQQQSSAGQGVGLSSAAGSSSSSSGETDRSTEEQLPHPAGGGADTTTQPAALSRQASQNIGESDMASQEELDAVIDILSRSHKYTTMQAIPESPALNMTSAAPPAPGVAHLPPNHGPPPPLPPKAVGSHLGGHPLYAPPALVMDAHSVHGNCVGYHGGRAHPHRQSDSLLAETVPRDVAYKTNTWPFRPRQKESGLASLGIDFPVSAAALKQYNLPPPFYGIYPDGIAVSPGEFDIGPAGIYGPLPHRPPPPNAPAPKFDPSQAYMAPAPNNPWSMTSDLGHQKAWPGFPQHVVDGQEQAPRQWSTMADSSSCSDESSSGELGWMMGGVPPQANSKRRHSSGGEQQASSFPAPPPPAVNSADDMMEPKSTHTWPPKHQWGSRPPPAMLETGGGRPATDLGLEDGGAMMHPHEPSRPPQHRPLIAQWSDPLTNLSVWDPASMGSSMSQPAASFDNLSLCGGPPGDAVGVAMP